MNKTITHLLLTIAFILVVMAYVVYNYLQGKSDMYVSVFSLVLLGYFLFSMIRGLIQALNNR